MTSEERVKYEVENVLPRFFKVRYYPGCDPRLMVKIDISNCFAGVYYWINFYKMSVFPRRQPVVTAGKMLYDCDGRAMNSPSSRQHLLGTYNGETWMCLFHDSDWMPNGSLYMLILKARGWLIAYHNHMKFGEPLETWLPANRVR